MIPNTLQKRESALNIHEVAALPAFNESLVNTVEGRRAMQVEERHFSPKELGKLWNMSHDSIIRLFRDEPGVLRLCPPHRRGVRRRVTYRIPESVAAKVHERCSNK
jgi:hypothetical protein